MQHLNVACMHKIFDFCKFQAAITLVKQLLLWRNLSLFLSDSISWGRLRFLISSAMHTSDTYNSKWPNYTFKTSHHSLTDFLFLIFDSFQIPTLQSEETNFVSSEVSWNLLMGLVLSLEPPLTMGAFCSWAASPLWTYFQGRVIMEGTVPQDEDLIPNRICLDSWISPSRDLLQTGSQWLSLLYLSSSLLEVCVCVKSSPITHHYFHFCPLLALFLPLCVSSHVCVFCVCACVSSKGHSPLEGAAVVWKTLTHVRPHSLTPWLCPFHPQPHA